MSGGRWASGERWVSGGRKVACKIAHKPPKTACRILAKVKQKVGI